MSDADRSIPVIPLEYAGPGESRQRRDLMIARVCLWTAAVACLGGWLLIFVDTETVLGSGPVLAASGAGLFAVALRLRCPIARVLGMAHCGLCALFVAMVNGLNWGPRQSTVPFLIMGGIYTFAVTIPLTVVAHRRLRAMCYDVRLSERVAPGRL